ncbi:MAG: cation:dicarboxylate symporter family transporter, partial [Thermoguttaceae bacterium]
MPLWARILVGLLVGAAAGISSHVWLARPHEPAVADPLDQDANGIDDRLDWAASNLADPLGRVFLRLILMVVLPLVFSALALAVVEMGNLRHLGRVG